MEGGSVQSPYLSRRGSMGGQPASGPTGLNKAAEPGPQQLPGSRAVVTEAKSDAVGGQTYSPQTP